MDLSESIKAFYRLTFAGYKVKVKQTREGHIAHFWLDKNAISIIAGAGHSGWNLFGYLHEVYNDSGDYN